jgi:hypothetical protein
VLLERVETLERERNRWRTLAEGFESERNLAKHAQAVVEQRAEKAERELAVNSGMLARQCDLAREAETRAEKAERERERDEARGKLEIVWRAGYGEAIRRTAAGETRDEQAAWDSVNKAVLPDTPKGANGE